MTQVADKVVRATSEAYEFLTNFANEHDLKISEALSILLQFCASKDLEVIRADVEVVERRPVVQEDASKDHK